MEKERERERVCVTGASGFIASWVIKLLLERGYTVNATVRSLKDPTKTEYLMGMDGAKERLNLFEANLMEDASFDLAIHGCHGVFHIASPVLFHSPNPQNDILDPAVKGTLNVLSSCRKCPSIRRVILTSSMATVIHSSRSQASEPEVVVDETWFSDPQLCKSIYSVSKTLAEEAALKFSKENGIDMVVINPGMVIGPMLQPALNATVAIILKLINGSETRPNRTMSWVYVKDVATAHISAFETPSANGRYCLVESVAYFSEVVKMLQELYPSLPIPDMCADDKPCPPTFQVSKEKAKNLGVEFVPMKVSLEKTVECLMQKEFLSF